MSQDKFEKGNISWLFTKEYYNNIPLAGNLQRPVMNFDYIPLLHIKKEDRTPEQKKELKEILSINSEGLKQKNKWLEEKKWPNYEPYAQLLKENAQKLTNYSFEAVVKNPGLLFGTGITHESGNEGEYKIGFYFDHTTGLVVIPGHAVKGIIRSRFPLLIKDPEIKERSYCEIYCLLNNLDYNEHIFNSMDPESVADEKKKIEDLEKEIFEGIKPNGERLSVYEEDLFLSAFIINSQHSKDLFLGKDAITPHGEDSLKNPIPLPFIKLLTKAEIQFNFKITDSIGASITGSQKKSLIEKIVKKYGIGSKTNVGYGQVTINKT